MNVLKKLGLSLLIIVLSLGCGFLIYYVQGRFFNGRNSATPAPPTPTPEVSEIPVVTPTEEPVQQQFVITNDTVNLRQGPGTNTAVIVKVPANTVLQLIYADAEWSSVVCEGQTGYVKNEFVSPYTQPVAAAQIGAGKIIAIDPGHQMASDPATEPIGPNAAEQKARVSQGTTGTATGKAESELNLEVALKLKAALEAAGYQVVMTRESQSVNISNAERAQIANNASANACISIHANSSTDPSVKGVMTVCPTAANPYCTAIYNNSYRLSNAVVNAVAASAGAVNAGIWQTDTMTGLNWSTVPVTILEMGYLTNAEEEQQLVTEDYQNKLVQGIVEGLNQYFNQ